MNSPTKGSLAISDLSLGFGGMDVLRSITLTIEPGIMTGIIGPNGSGKTSLLNCINGVYKPQSGRIALDGTDLGGLSTHRRTSLGITRTFQHVEAPRGQSVIEYVMLGCYPQHRRRGALQAGIGIPWFSGDERSDTMAAEEVLEFVGLAEHAKSAIGALPYGLMKRADLARALVRGPHLLLLDEPAAGLSFSERIELRSLLLELRGQGLTVCLIEHDMDLISGVSNRLVVLVGGSKAADGSIEEVMQLEHIRRTFLGAEKVVTQQTGDR